MKYWKLNSLFIAHNIQQIFFEIRQRGGIHIPLFFERPSNQGQYLSLPHFFFFFSRLGFWSGLTLAVFNFHFIISSLRLLPVVICNFYQDLFIIASDATDAVINHARQLGTVVTVFSNRSHWRAGRGGKKWALR